MTFKELNLISPILAALQTQGYDKPTPIQQQAITPALEGKDLLGCAQTGTGKTAAFALPILQRLNATGAVKNKRRARALILTPTRELALQIHESLIAYGKQLPLKGTVIFGGVSQNPQTEQLARGTDILVATPGRLIDLINQGFVDLSGLEIFVLDEADRMLDMGFINDVKKVVARLPQKRQTMLFSATMPAEIEQLANSMLTNPVKVSVAPPATTVELIEQSVYLTDKVNKRELLTWILKNHSIYSALVFTRTKHGADRVAKALNGAKISSMSIHGDKSQGARQLALSNFKSGRVQVLVATDIAARGIDIDQLSHVINFDLPNEPDTYVHRIGRTGRAGADGVAMSFCDFDELEYLKDIEKLIRKKIRVEQENPYPMQVFEPAPKKPTNMRRRNDMPRQQAARPTKPAPQKAAKPTGDDRPSGQSAAPKRAGSSRRKKHRPASKMH
ncbi:DEAD/DEAH box helicase [Oscillospiraceae bacterium LTW-04]|nr:DEAD/DEAH box helicase [Oscillospiraceae bacterium MB24-C1]